jgi:hypothetical protein
MRSPAGAFAFPRGCGKVPVAWTGADGCRRAQETDLERFMAKRMGAKTIEVKSSHLSLISHPDAITNLIREAAGQSA